MRFFFLAFVAALVLAISAAPAAGSSRVEFGIQDDAWLEFGPGRLSDRVAALDRLGLDVVRVTLDWQRIEPEPGEFRWGRSDRILRALDARGLDPVVTVWGTPGWANGDRGPNIAPQNGDDFFRFTQALAERYRFVEHWVMWNEPNKALWLNPASPETYVARILNPGYRGIKSVNRRDLVAGGVTAPRGGRGGTSPADFIHRMDRARAQLDAYAHHPYPVYAGDTPFAGGCSCETITMATLERLLRIVGQAFPSARIWLTEYAYQSRPDPYGVSLASQARFIGEAARRVYAAPRVDMLVHYLYRDEPDIERWQSGLETVSGRAKPARAATMLPLAQVSRSGTRVILWGQIRPGDGAQRYVLEKLEQGSWVAVGAPRTTSSRGFLTRAVVAERGAKFRLWYPTGRLASPTLIVR